MKFSQSIPKAPQENDRVELTAGTKLSITDIVISEQTRFGKVAKINGFKIGTKEPVKFYTTGKVIIKGCEQILAAHGSATGNLAEPVDVEVVKVLSANKQHYLLFKDPA